MTVRHLISFALLASLLAVTPVVAATVAGPAPPPSDSTLTLRGGQEGTVFRTLTVEGEDRIHVDFERPELMLDLQPADVPGLDLGTARDVLDRTLPDLVAPLQASSAAFRAPYLARPWLRQFGSGSVARFHPEVKDVERWRLMVADAKGQTVKTFEGRGRPPQEIAWDGAGQDGAPVVPGLTYSYVFEAHDRAGNRCNFVGEGFRVAAFCMETPDGPALAFAGRLLAVDGPALGAAPSAIVLEAASWLNHSAAVRRPVRVTATARSPEQATALASAVVRQLSTCTLGDPARLQAVTRVEPDAAEDGVVRITPVAPR
jgi:hypothetical protein